MSLLAAGDRPPWPWQEAVWQRLCRQKLQNALAHAYLFCADHGTGRSGFIREFGNLLLCANPVNDRACRQCRSCRSGGDDHHPDLFLAVPEEGKKDIGVGLIREMTEFLSRSSYSGLARVAIIPAAEKLTLAAANALLKTLEEPADRAFLLLSATSSGGLLPTIRSRCQILPLAGPDPEAAASWLSGQLGPQSAHALEELEQMLEACGNRPLQALAGLRSGDPAGYAALPRLLTDLLSGGVSVQQAAREAAKVGESAIFEQLDRISTILIRGLVTGAWRNSSIRALTETLPGTGDTARLSALLEFHRQVIMARTLLAGSGNPNPQLLLESIFRSWRRQQPRQAA